MRTLLASFLVLSLVWSPLLRAHDPNAGAEMAAAAQNLLAALTPDQKAKGQLAFTDEERKNWHFIPRARKGLPIKEMTQPQRLLAQALLASGLSSRGYQKAVTIMSLEEILGQLEHDRKGTPVRDAELYYVTIFGEPGPESMWGWRVEGHHLSLNFASTGDTVISMTPSFFGTNPAEIREGPRKGLRVLAEEEDLGFALVKALTEEQRKEAIVLAEPPKDIVNVPGRNERTSPAGLPQDKMTAEQQKLLSEIIHTYLFRNRVDVAAEDWRKVEEAGLAKVQFAWAGGIEAGQPHYYRVQGPTFVLEFDNTQNGANHVHTVWRDFDNDFGSDPLLKHYQEAHGGK